MLWCGVLNVYYIGNNAKINIKVILEENLDYSTIKEVFSQIGNLLI